MSAQESHEMSQCRLLCIALTKILLQYVRGSVHDMISLSCSDTQHGRTVKRDREVKACAAVSSWPSST